MLVNYGTGCAATLLGRDSDGALARLNDLALNNPQALGEISLVLDKQIGLVLHAEDIVGRKYSVPVEDSSALLPQFRELILSAKPQGTLPMRERPSLEISHTTTSAPPTITALPYDYWRIKGVNYRNGIHTVDLAKQLLLNGEARTQEQWAEHATNALQTGEFYTPNYKLFYSTIRAVKNSSSPEKEEIRKFLQSQARANWLMTLTRIRYMPKKSKSLEEVIHDFGLPSQFSEQVEFVGKDEYTKDTTTPQVYKALLGTDNVQEINDVYHWLGYSGAFLHRLNKKPTKIDERIAGFDVYFGWAFLDCGRCPRPTRISRSGYVLRALP